jgi:2'-5' RNA ligase
MRLFVGLEIDRRVAAAAADLVDELRRRAGRLAPRARITWATEDRFHITVRFIGAATEAKAGEIREALSERVDEPAFDLALAGTGAFPERGEPRVLWAGVARGTDALVRIEGAVSRRLAAAGIAPEARAYRPHLTLARVRDGAGLRTPVLLEGVRDRSLGVSHVEAITLFESRLSPTGPAYVALQRTQLA